MAKQIEVRGFMYEVDYGFDLEKEYRFFSSDDMGDAHYTLIGPVAFAYEIPDDFNPTKQKLAALEAEKAKVRAAYLAKVREIEERISKLQAIEFVA